MIEEDTFAGDFWVYYENNQGDRLEIDVSRNGSFDTEGAKIEPIQVCGIPAYLIDQTNLSGDKHGIAKVIVVNETDGYILSVNSTPHSGITRLTCTLDISSSGSADCHAKIAMSAGYSSDYTLTLLYSKDGRTWSEVTSWDGSNSTDVTKSHFIYRKGDYQLRLTVKVLDSSGKYVATYGKNSNVVSY